MRRTNDGKRVIGLNKTYRFLYAILAPLIRFFYRIKTVNPENIPEGGCLICANHTAFSDVFVLAASVKKRQIKFMAKKELFSVPVLGKLITALGAFPVDRGGVDVGSLKRTIGYLKNGDTVGIFPQGTRRPSVDPRTTEPRYGIGMIAWHSKTDVLPVYIRTKNNKLHMFGKTEVIFGKVIKNEELGFENGGNAEYKAAAKYVFDKICDMSDEAAADRADKDTVK